MRLIQIALVAVIFSAALVGQAAALSFKDIAGLWCGTVSNYNFARHRLTVTFHNGSRTRHFRVLKYEYPPHIVRMRWKDSNGKELVTDFSEFDPHGHTMAQVKNEAGPRRPFSRCK